MLLNHSAWPCLGPACKEVFSSLCVLPAPRFSCSALDVQMSERNGMVSTSRERDPTHACIYPVTIPPFNGEIVVAATGPIFLSLKFKFLRLDGFFRHIFCQFPLSVKLRPHIVGISFRAVGLCTGLGFIISHRLRECRVKKLRYVACCRQENTIFSPHIHTTHGK